MKERNFGEDFVRPAIAGLNKKAAQRVSVALDCAIAFGALEHAAGNESLEGITPHKLQVMP